MDSNAELRLAIFWLVGVLPRHKPFRQRSMSGISLRLCDGTIFRAWLGSSERRD